MDQVRSVMRLRHYSIHTERTNYKWIPYYFRFHKMNSRHDLADAEQKIEALLTHLAIHANVAPATQNQAINVLVFLYGAKRYVDYHDLHTCSAEGRPPWGLPVPSMILKQCHPPTEYISGHHGTRQATSQQLMSPSAPRNGN